MEKNSGAYIFEQIKDSFNFDIIRRFFFLASLAVSVAVGFSMYQWVQEPLYRPLDYTVTDQNMTSILDALDKAHIPYKLNDLTGMVSVPVSAIQKARQSLIAAGVSKEEGFNFSFLNEDTKLGGSQFIENARYLHALEADLAKTIRSIQGISGAKVTIARPQNNVFADENTKTTASVIIHVMPGYEGDKEKIRSIIQLVSASVPELEPSNVAITDQYGHFLSSLSDADYGYNQEQLTYQHNVEHSYEKRIQALILPIIGANKASISVNAEIDFTQQEQAKEAYEPDQNVVRSEQILKEDNTSSSASGVPGALSNQPPSSQSVSSTGQTGGQSRSEQVKNYEITKLTTYVKNNPVQIKRLSVAIILDNDGQWNEKTKKMISRGLDKEKLNNITELVKSSIGYNESRGDRVTVVNSPFMQPKVEVIPKTSFWEEPWFWDFFKKSVGILVGSIVLFLFYKKMAPEFFGSKTSKETEKLDLLSKSAGVSPEMLKLKDEQIDILKDLVEKDPNKVAAVIKKWVAK